MTDQQPNPYEGLGTALRNHTAAWNAAVATVALRFTAAAAVGAALNGADDRLAAILESLTPEQLAEVVNAASATGIAASRRRKTLRRDDQAVEYDEPSADTARLLAPIATAIRTTRWVDDDPATEHDRHRYNRNCAVCICDVDELARAILPVIAPETDALLSYRDDARRQRARADALAVDLDNAQDEIRRLREGRA